MRGLLALQDYSSKQSEAMPARAYPVSSVTKHFPFLQFISQAACKVSILVSCWIQRMSHGCTCRGERHELVGHQDPGLAAQQAADAAVQQVPAHVRVHRRQRVVQQHHVGLSVAGSRQGDSLLLPAAQIDAFLADLSVVTCRNRSPVFDCKSSRDNKKLQISVSHQRL